MTFPCYVCCILKLPKENQVLVKFPSPVKRYIIRHYLFFHPFEQIITPRMDNKKKQFEVPFLLPFVKTVIAV